MTVFSMFYFQFTLLKDLMILLLNPGIVEYLMNHIYLDLWNHFGFLQFLYFHLKVNPYANISHTNSQMMVSLS